MERKIDEYLTIKTICKCWTSTKEPLNDHNDISAVVYHARRVRFTKLSSKSELSDASIVNRLNIHDD